MLATDARRNLALLELASVPETAAEAKFAAEAPSPGDSLHVMDNPNRLDVLWVYTAASVRQRGRVNLGQTTEGPDPDVLIVQAPLADGEGGGPLLNDRGELVGVVSGKTGPQQEVAFCLTAAEVRGFIDENRLRREPDSAAAPVRRGDVFLKARQYPRAVADFDAAPAAGRPLRPSPVRARPGRVPPGARTTRRCATAARRSRRSRSWQPLTAGARPRSVARANRAWPWPIATRPWQSMAQCALAHAVRGDAYRRLGDLDKALADCDEAVWLDRQLAVAYLYRGQVLAEKGKPDKAIADFTRALQFDEHLSEAHRDRADAEWFKSDVAAALADYDQALAIRPDDAAALHGRGRALAAQGRHDAALAALDAALKIDPRRAAACIDRGARTTGRRRPRRRPGGFRGGGASGAGAGGGRVDGSGPRGQTRKRQRLGASCAVVRWRRCGRCSTTDRGHKRPSTRGCPRRKVSMTPSRWRPSSVKP